MWKTVSAMSSSLPKKVETQERMPENFWSGRKQEELNSFAAGKILKVLVVAVVVVGGVERLKAPTTQKRNPIL